MLLCGKILWQPQPRGLEGAQCSCKADLLFCLQPQVEVLGCLEDEHDVELRLNSPRNKKVEPVLNPAQPRWQRQASQGKGLSNQLPVLAVTLTRRGGGQT